ncbi:MAG: hypothetical protein AAGJ84_09190 [Pseudomonadota bacterium]
MTADDVFYTFMLNDACITKLVVREAVEVNSPPLELNPGDIVEVRLGSNANARGDATSYRIKILEYTP